MWTRAEARDERDETKRLRCCSAIRGEQVACVAFSDATAAARVVGDGIATNASTWAARRDSRDERREPGRKNEREIRLVWRERLGVRTAAGAGAPSCRKFRRAHFAAAQRFALGAQGRHLLDKRCFVLGVGGKTLAFAAEVDLEEEVMQLGG
jgi:hypothetical protein